MRLFGKRVGKYFLPSLIITILSVIGVLVGQIFNEPDITTVSALFLLFGSIITIGSSRVEVGGYYVPRPTKSRAHIYSAIIMVVSLLIYFVLEAVLDFESLTDYWVSGFFGVIGILMIFITIGLTIAKYKENKGIN